jgi:predicted flap endonuclease-1-like 5' DNA nuclease
MTAITDIEGIGPAHAEKLQAAGVATVEALLGAGASAAGRNDLAGKTGISDSLILEWVNHADLFRIKGVGSELADLLEAAGVDSVPELAQRNVASLAAKIAELNYAKALVRRCPSEAEVADWIEHAKTLGRIVTH